jgi:hypothetical protein
MLLTRKSHVFASVRQVLSRFHISGLALASPEDSLRQQGCMLCSEVDVYAKARKEQGKKKTRATHIPIWEKLLTT